MSELHYKDCGHACCLRVENLAVTIGGSQILKDMNLHVHCGEMVALIGVESLGCLSSKRLALGPLLLPHVEGNTIFHPTSFRSHAKPSLMRFALDRSRSSPVQTQSPLAGDQRF